MVISTLDKNKEEKKRGNVGGKGLQCQKRRPGRHPHGKGELDQRPGGGDRVHFGRRACLNQF